MFIFVVVFFLLAFGIRFGKNKYWLFVCTLIMAILIGTRAISVGTDTKSYLTMYESAMLFGYQGYPEPGYGMAQVFFCNMGFDFTMFQTAMSIVMCLMLYMVIRRVSSNYAFSLFVFYALYFVMYSMNVFRQVFAVVILLCAYSYLFKGKKIYFVIGVIIASLFHMSSVIALPTLFINRLRIRKTYIVISVICFSFILGIVLSPQLYTSLAGGYAHYLINADSMRSGNRLLLSIALSTFWSALFIICFLSTNYRLRENFWFKMYFIATVANNICLRMELGIRIMWILSICEVIALPLCVKYSRKISKTSMSGIIISALTIFFFAMLLTNSADVLPYESKILK